MRDLVSCFGDYAVRVADPPPPSSCTSACSTLTAEANANKRQGAVPSTQNAVNCLYRLDLSASKSGKQLLVTVVWCRTQTGQALSLGFGDDPSATLKLGNNSRFFKKKWGSKAFDSNNSKIEAFWDLSSARYGPGPEPTDGFYVLVVVGSELGLALGDLAGEAAARRFGTGSVAATAGKLVSRREHFYGGGIYATRAQFCDSGAEHEILIHCRGEEEGLKHPVLSVAIDKKSVVCVKRLRWNFRGNQTLFVDGLLVDLMWDVHDWFCGNGKGYGNGVFMFRTRKGMESRLWLEEKLLEKKEKEKDQRLDRSANFSLFIYACKSSPWA